LSIIETNKRQIRFLQTKICCFSFFEKLKK
jgi:hypothetical protein